MIILTLRTDKPEAEVGLYKDGQQMTYKKWEAHRQLAETLHQSIQNLLKEAALNWADIGAIICYQGPGSFTGLRIGVSVANALGYSNKIAVIGTSGKDWIEDGLARAQNMSSKTKPLIPDYGSPPHITAQKK